MPTTVQSIAQIHDTHSPAGSQRESVTQQIEDGRNYATRLSAEVDAIMDSVTPVEIFTDPEIRAYLQSKDIVRNDPAAIQIELGVENTEFAGWMKTELNRDIPASILALVGGVSIDQSVEESTLEIGPNGITIKIPRPIDVGRLKQFVYLGVASIFRNSSTDERLEEFYEICKRNPQIVHIGQLKTSLIYLNARELLKQRSENSAVIVNEAEALHFLRTGKMMATENQLLGRYVQREVNRTDADKLQEARACHRIAQQGLTSLHANSFDFAFLNMYVKEDLRGKRPDIMDVLVHGNDQERSLFMQREIQEKCQPNDEMVRVLGELF